jgi:alkyl sulfatase BDS1-like metallo-beta-lactamase superfamily hydrolase
MNNREARELLAGNCESAKEFLGMLDTFAFWFNTIAP